MKLPIGLSLRLEFWARVIKEGPNHPTLGICWNWTGPTGQGYGKLSGSHKCRLAHRVSWILHNGPIPVGLWVLHACDNRLCVNPSHLFLGTHDDNMEDMARKGRSGRTKLTDEQVREIRQRFRRGNGRGRHGSNAGILAKEMGVTTTAIRLAAEGQNHKYLT